MSGIGVMDPSQGAAWRFQLDGILGALRPLAQRAGEMGDQPVIDLLTALQLAHEAAVKIETRSGFIPARSGVRLSKTRS